MRTSGYLVAAAALCSAGCLAATVAGVVRDAQGRPVARASVYLQAKATGESATMLTDAQGHFSFAALKAGSYTLRAQASGTDEATASPVVVSDKETREVNLTLQYAFYDEPAFIVAGVTDTMSRGGHGSDTVLRSAESLASATAALANPSTAAAAAEKQGQPLLAAREYQRVAELNPSEANLFDWGAELLKHRAAAAANDVFTKGNHLFPQSLRILLGLAAAGYARGSYDQAAARFFEACDLAPDNPQPYMFLGAVQSNDIIQLPGYVARMKRFAALHPENAWASYYYAVGLWKQRQAPEDADTPRHVRELLEKAISHDPNLGAAYLLLGIVFSDQGSYTQAIAAYQKAIAARPELEEAHYRLGQAYERAGRKDDARKELETYKKMSQQSAEQADRDRAQIRQFVIELRNQ